MRDDEKENDAERNGLSLSEMQERDRSGCLQTTLAE